jgi:hypothetical protein
MTAHVTDPIILIINGNEKDVGFICRKKRQTEECEQNKE